MYLKLLEYLALLVVQRTNDTIGDTAFGQNNAPVHTASVVTDCLEKHNIQVDERPPYSSDLNSIEHVLVVPSNCFTNIIQISLTPSAAPVLLDPDW